MRVGLEHLFILFLVIQSGAVPALGSVKAQHAGMSCAGNTVHLKERRQELKTIYEEDQSDRVGFENMRDDALEALVPKDRARLRKLNVLVAENCLRNAEDYLMAAKIMMHQGKTTTFLKAFTWAKKAQDLGDNSASARITLAQSIDRYLVNTGHKQLFASQARQDSSARCWCLNNVEKEFPDSKRAQYGGRDLDAAFSWVDEMNQGLGCHLGRYCKDNLRPTPKGSAPGVW